MIRVAALHSYPIKSLGGTTTATSEVGPRGLRLDRRWMLVDEEGVFLSQRTFERMALFRVQTSDWGLVVCGPGGPWVMVPYEPGEERMKVRIWQSEVEAIRVSDEVDAWFTEELGRSARLVYMPDETIRPTHPEFSSPGDHVGFADAMPVLVAGEASLDDLNARLETPVPMNRFRANIIVRGSLPYAEDDWPGFTLGGVRFRHAKTCGRCRVTTTDQDTAVVGVEPLKTLATYRRRENSVIFGAYYIPESTGRIAVHEPLIFDE